MLNAMSVRGSIRVTAALAAILFLTATTWVQARLWGDEDRLVLTPGGSLTDGKWKLDLDAYQDSRRNGLQVEIKTGPNSMRVQSLPSERAPRLDRYSDKDAIHFSIETDPGDLVFTGTVARKIASGTYRFEPKADFTSEAGKLLKRDLSTEDLLELAFSDVSLKFIRTVAAAGITADYDGILLLRHNGVSAEMAKGYAEAKVRKPSDIVRLRNFGASPEFARDARAAGYGESIDDLVKLRSFAVSVDFLKSWKDAGFALSTEEIVKVRNFGLNAEYGAAWKKAGYNLTVDEMVRARNFGVPADFAAAIVSKGARPSIDEAIKMRQFGVDAKYFKSIREASTNYSAGDIVKLRQFGVPADFVAAVNIPGRTPVDAQTIVDLRNRGVSADMARKLRE